MSHGNRTAGPSELGIVFENHLKLLAQHDVPSGLQFAAEEGLQRDRGREQPLPWLWTSFQKDTCSDGQQVN